MIPDNLEVRFTPGNEFCQHPAYYHSPDSEATEEEVSEFIGSLVRLIQPEFVVETGTYHGHTTLEIANALWNNGHGTLTTIEKERNEYDIAIRHVGNVGVNVEFILGNTLDYVPEEDIDFAFFDSWQEGRAEEFMRFYDLDRLKKDTIVAFHDTAPHHQVWKYVKELEDGGYIKTITFHTPRGLTIAQVL